MNIERDDLRAMRHDGRDFSVAEVEDAFHNIVFRLIEFAIV